MASKIAIVCPHCASTGSHDVAGRVSNGSVPVQCNSCRKTFRVLFSGGQLSGTSK